VKITSLLGFAEERTACRDAAVTGEGDVSADGHTALSGPAASIEARDVVV
jgi:hypothetical protein